MTNKNEMVSEFAALAYKELAERLAHYLSSALVSAQYSMTDETMHDALGLCDQVTRRKSAPAEDVRAVVDEPVYQVLWAAGWEDVEYREWWLAQASADGPDTRVLYRHPQLPAIGAGA